MKTFRFWFHSWLGVFVAATAADSYADLPGDCADGWTPVPPFLVSGVAENTEDRFEIYGKTALTVGRTSQGANPKDTLLTEKLRIDRDPNSRNYRVLARGSLVKLADIPGSKLDSLLAPGAAETLVRVEILQPSPSHRFPYLSKQIQPPAPQPDPGASPLPPPPPIRIEPRVGEQGFLLNKALKRMDSKDSLVLTQDAKFFSFSRKQGAVFEAGSAMRPIEEAGKYKIVRCPGPTKDKDIVLYLYRVFDPEDPTIEEVIFSNPSIPGCLPFQVFSEPGLKDLLKLRTALKRIYPADGSVRLADLEMNEFGMVRLPMKRTADYDFPDEAMDGSFVHFRGNEPEGSAIWAEPDAACGFMKLAKEWKSHCESSGRRFCTIQLGDAAFCTPGKLKDSPHDPVGHKFHYSGRCFDIRPIRSDAPRGRVALQEPTYDSAATAQLVAFLNSRKASPLYFNDPAAITVPNVQCDMDDSDRDIGKGVFACPGHDNHIHFCVHPQAGLGCDR